MKTFPKSFLSLWAVLFLAGLSLVHSACGSKSSPSSPSGRGGNNNGGGPAASVACPLTAPSSLFQIGTTGTGLSVTVAGVFGNGGLGYGNDLAIDPANGYLYVYDFGKGPLSCLDNRVQQFNLSGAYQREFYPSGNSSAGLDYGTCAGMAADSAGNFYYAYNNVSNDGHCGVTLATSEIIKFNSSGVSIGAFNDSSNSDGAMRAIYCMTIDSQNNLYVVAGGNSNVLIRKLTRRGRGFGLSFQQRLLGLRQRAFHRFQQQPLRAGRRGPVGCHLQPQPSSPRRLGQRRVGPGAALPRPWAWRWGLATWFTWWTIPAPTAGSRSSRPTEPSCDELDLASNIFTWDVKTDAAGNIYVEEAYQRRIRISRQVQPRHPGRADRHGHLHPDEYLYPRRLFHADEHAHGYLHPQRLLSPPTATPTSMAWTSQTLPSYQSWTSVTYGNGVFAAVARGPSAVAATSPDGISWTGQTLPSSQAWESVAYGNGEFVAVASGSGLSGTTAAATSPDGSAWTAHNLPSAQNWKTVAYGNGEFVAVGSLASGFGRPVGATTPDGVTWTSRTLPSSQGWTSVTYGNGVFVAVGDGTSNVAATSPDGITWTSRTLPSSQGWYSVTYGNGVFVVVVDGGAAAATSPDGITWTDPDTP